MECQSSILEPVLYWENSTPFLYYGLSLPPFLLRRFQIPGVAVSIPANFVNRRVRNQMVQNGLKFVVTQYGNYAHERTSVQSILSI
jgi:hypothetical protein